MKHNTNPLAFVRQFESTLAEQYDNDDPINGADCVDWVIGLMPWARAILEAAEQPDPPNHTTFTPCCARFELANGEHVSPCHLSKGHEGDHEGICLGSALRWPQGFTSEYEVVHEGEE